MTPRTQRAVIDFVWTTATFMGLYIAGAGLWALLITPYACWNYYDGATRSSLPGDGKQ